MSGRARLRVVYVERGAHHPPIIWQADDRSHAAADADQVDSGQDVHRVFGLLLARARFDGRNDHGRVVRAGRSLLAESDIDQANGRRLKATIVVSTAGGRPGWARPCAQHAAAVLRDHDLTVPVDRLGQALERGWRDSAGSWRLLMSLRRKLALLSTRRREMTS
jgi:hypothetical protein